MGNFKLCYIFVGCAIALYLMGRLCDDMDWYTFDISSPKLEGISIAGLAACVIIMAVTRLLEPHGWKVIFFESQVKFVIPWALIILECVLTFSIFGCANDDRALEGQDMTYQGCIEYSIVLLLTNLIYSFACNGKTELAFLIAFETVLLAEIIYSGTLLIMFINNLKDKAKDYSILFISIIITWQILVMDLIFRAAYLDRIKEEDNQRLENMMHQIEKKCNKEEGESAAILAYHNETKIAGQHNVAKLQL
jgi:hypothetical protein